MAQQKMKPPSSLIIPQKTADNDGVSDIEIGKTKRSSQEADDK